MDRYWLLTSTFYGNWLPGDPRGFVSRVREVQADEPRGADSRGADATPLARHEHDVHETPYDKDFVGLHRHARQQLKGEPVRIIEEQAREILQQFQETAAFRGWQLLAVAIMSNHVHLVVGVNGDPDPTKVLGDFKAYASRALACRWGKPLGGTWWTYAGSKRKLADERAVNGAIHYVRRQPNALIVWTPGERGCVSAPSSEVSAPSMSELGGGRPSGR